MNGVLVGRIVIVAIVATGFFWLDDFQAWQYKSHLDKINRTEQAELLHFKQQHERYHELVREGADPALMFEAPELPDDSTTYGMP